MFVNFFLKIVILSSIFLGQLTTLAAQSFWVGSQNDQILRIISLQDSSTIQHSMMIRPIQLDTLQNNNSILNHSLQGNKTLVKKKLFTLNALPLDWVNQFNTHHPYGWNDGPMIGAKGYQTVIRTGLQLQSKFLDIQLAPELVYANNAPYPTNTNYGSNTFSAFNKVYAGQSHVKLKLGKIGIGISLENLWWGPGIRSSLLMSNNAPGFLHASIHTRTPLKTLIGQFEFQVVGGSLNSFTNMPYENLNQLERKGYAPQARYLNAVNLVYQPKGVDGLHLGITRVLQGFQSGISQQGTLLRRYIPVIFQPLQKQGNFGIDTLQTDQLASIFLRWVFPKKSFEFYGELGYNDYKLNARDYALNTTHSLAYTVGFKKVIKASNQSFWDIIVENTRMSQSPDSMVRNAGTWYEHTQIQEGYTQHNQILGAGAGWGTNLQTLMLSHYKKKDSWSFWLEHLDRNPDNFVTRWNDWVIGFQHKRRYEKLFVDAQLQFVNSKNYAWEQGRNTFNLFARLGLTYLW